MLARPRDGSYTFTVGWGESCLQVRGFSLKTLWIMPLCLCLCIFFCIHGTMHSRSVAATACFLAVIVRQFSCWKCMVFRVMFSKPQKALPGNRWKQDTTKINQVFSTRRRGSGCRSAWNSHQLSSVRNLRTSPTGSYHGNSWNIMRL